MDYQEAIENHIKECRHRIDIIRNHMNTNGDADKGVCNKNIEVLEISIHVMQELQQYKQIGALEEVRDAVELQQADKPRISRLSAHGVPDGYLYSCPNCEYRIIKKDNRGFYSGTRTKYCPDCGKRLDWSDEYD